MEKSEIRKSYFLNKYVIITPSRKKRPRDIKETTVIERTGECVFCPENVKKNNVIVKKFGEKEKGWDILVIENKFPAVTLDNKLARGYQEVIIETPDHAEVLAQFPANRIDKLLRVYADRTKDISKNRSIEYILVKVEEFTDFRM